MKFSIKLLYLYLFSFIGLLITVIGTVQLVDLGIKVYIFKGADQYSYSAPIMAPDGKNTQISQTEIDNQKRMQDTETQRQRQRQTSTAASMILVGIPLYLYHWKKINS